MVIPHTDNLMHLGTLQEGQVRYMSSIPKTRTFTWRNILFVYENRNSRHLSFSRLWLSPRGRYRRPKTEISQMSEETEEAIHFYSSHEQISIHKAQIHLIISISAIQNNQRTRAYPSAVSRREFDFTKYQIRMK